MAQEQADYLAKMNIDLKDEIGRFGDADRILWLDQAARQYSKARPLIITDTLVGDGTEQTFDTPTSWSKGFSVIDAVEYPINEVPTRFQELDAFVEVVRRGSVDKIITIAITLSNLAEIRIYYKAQHKIIATGSTPIDVDFDAICQLATSFHALALATFYADNSDASLDADTVDHEEEARRYQDLSDTMYSKYRQHFEADEGVTEPVIIHHDTDIRSSGDQEFLAHSSHRR